MATAARSLTVIALMLLAACSKDQATPADTTVEVALQEFAVLPAASTAPAGDVTFTATNTGPNDQHELLVLKTDLDPGALPVDANGAVDEAGSGFEVIGEIEPFDVDTTESVTFTLTAGKYVLACNIYDEAEDEAHYKLGMRTAFNVT